MKELHKHQWIYQGKSCCYRLSCSVTGCGIMTTANYHKGEHPKSGDKVQILDDGKTIEVVE